jgi:hypothetical protein
MLASGFLTSIATNAAGVPRCPPGADCLEFQFIRSCAMVSVDRSSIRLTLRPVTRCSLCYADGGSYPWKPARAAWRDA